jgi:sulfur-oxidizing protein SoxY
VLAAWPKSAFEAKSVPDALSGLGINTTAASGDIQIKAPDIAENGAVVPVTVKTSIGGVSSISIFAEKNNSPLTSNFNLKGSAQGFVATRIKMQKTSAVIAVVKAGGKAYSARKEVKVTIGGCGG